MFREAAQVLLTLMRCISMKRALRVSGTDRLNFFRLYDGCLMDSIAISWCKLFGSPREDLSWRKLFPVETTRGKDLERKLESDAGGLKNLSNKMREYRDTYVAHHDLDETKRASEHPSLDPVRDTGFTLYAAIHEELSAAGNSTGLPHPTVFSGSKRDEIEAHWRGIADAARSAVSSFGDNPAG